MSAVFPPNGGPGPSRPAPRPASVAPPGVSAGTGLVRQNLRALEPPAANRGTGIAVVVGLHVLLAYALSAGLGRQAIELIKKPMQMAIIPEQLPPPPPPPPPKIEKVKEITKPKLEVAPPPPPAYVPPPEQTPPVAAPPPPITQVQQAEPPKKAVEIAPPPPPAPVTTRTVVKQEASVACPGHTAVLERSLAEVFERVGIVGTVRFNLVVRGNQVVEATPVSGPREYYKYVQSAIKRMKCSASGADEVQVPLTVDFKEE